MKSGLPCQDYSLDYHDAERTIIACCDGHGGARYIRSDRGSRFACEAVLNVFKGLAPSFLYKYKDKEAEDRIRMELLCEWNKLVERDIANHPFTKKELESLSEDDREALMLNRAKAYGTTMTGALLLSGKLVVAGIGDSECLLINKGEAERPLERESDPAGNITYSLCQDDAYSYIRAAVVNFYQYDGVVLCTDGFSGPYQSYENMKESFLKPLVKKTLWGRSAEQVHEFVGLLAEKKGTGDDVSIAYIIDGSASIKHYE
ncbi:MAG: protein phosphatase 2C domain-containing protein [Bacilli bacterium]|nr:protein phosphatase 2C domain-containing protein [Bacilli bacterium]